MRAESDAIDGSKLQVVDASGKAILLKTDRILLEGLIQNLNSMMQQPFYIQEGHFRDASLSLGEVLEKILRCLEKTITLYSQTPDKTIALDVKQLTLYGSQVIDLLQAALKDKPPNHFAQGRDFDFYIPFKASGAFDSTFLQYLKEAMTVVSPEVKIQRNGPSWILIKLHDPFNIDISLGSPGADSKSYRGYYDAGQIVIPREILVQRKTAHLDQAMVQLPNECDPQIYLDHVRHDLLGRPDRDGFNINTLFSYIKKISLGALVVDREMLIRTFQQAVDSHTVKSESQKQNHREIIEFFKKILGLNPVELLNLCILWELTKFQICRNFECFEGNFRNKIHEAFSQQSFNLDPLIKTLINPNNTRSIAVQVHSMISPLLTASIDEPLNITVCGMPIRIRQWYDYSALQITFVDLYNQQYFVSIPSLLCQASNKNACLPNSWRKFLDELEQSLLLACKKKSPLKAKERFDIGVEKKATHSQFPYLRALLKPPPVSQQKAILPREPQKSVTHLVPQAPHQSNRIDNKSRERHTKFRGKHNKAQTIISLPAADRKESKDDSKPWDRDLDTNNRFAILYVNADNIRPYILRHQTRSVTPVTETSKTRTNSKSITLYFFKWFIFLAMPLFLSYGLRGLINKRDPEVIAIARKFNQIFNLTLPDRKISRLAQQLDRTSNVNQSIKLQRLSGVLDGLHVLSSISKEYPAQLSLTENLRKVILYRSQACADIGVPPTMWLFIWPLRKLSKKTGRMFDYLLSNTERDTKSDFLVCDHQLLQNAKRFLNKTRQAALVRFPEQVRPKKDILPYAYFGLPYYETVMEHALFNVLETGYVSFWPELCDQPSMFPLIYKLIENHITFVNNTRKDFALFMKSEEENLCSFNILPFYDAMFVKPMSIVRLYGDTQSFTERAREVKHTINAFKRWVSRELRENRVAYTTELAFLENEIAKKTPTSLASKVVDQLQNSLELLMTRFLKKRQLPSYTPICSTAECQDRQDAHNRFVAMMENTTVARSIFPGTINQ